MNTRVNRSIDRSRSQSSVVLTEGRANLDSGAAAGGIGRRPGNRRPGAGVGAEPPVADAGQGHADGARAEGGEHRVQPGHPLRQQDELPAAAAGHQQEPPAQELGPRGRGERQQQLRHQQVRMGGQLNVFFFQILIPIGVITEIEH